MQVFTSADHYTLMSLYDVIYQICTAFGDKAQPLAIKLMPLMINLFKTTDELQANSMISLLGKATPCYLSLIECLQAMVKIMKTELEPYIRDLLSRSCAIVQWLLQTKTSNLNVSIHTNKFILSDKVSWRAIVNEY